MRGISFKHGLLALAATAAGLCAPLASAADVKAARVWAGPEYTRVVFDLSGPAGYKLSQGDTPGSVVLDLDKSVVVGGFAAPGGQGLFKSMRTEKQGDRARIVASVDAKAKPKSFLLKPAGDYGYRLVLDLYPGNGADPGDEVASSDDGGASASATASAAVVTPARGSRNRRGSAAASAPALPGGDRKVVVAIDAGHGGEDPGARGPTGLREKDVTLQVARELADQINRQPGMQAVLTRNGDYFIPLKRRYQIAREHNADMFVSIHADAFKNGDAKGSSVWVLSPRGKTSEASRWLADRENRADLVGGVSLDDKDDTLAAVLLDLQQGYAMQASESIAGNVLKALGVLGPTHRGYVERANFVVLRSPDVPSILVETAFITNPAEERRLRDDAHRRQLASAVLGGVRNYFESMPPPGTWFAAQAARRNGTALATTAAAAPVAPAVASDATAIAADAVKAASRTPPPKPVTRLAMRDTDNDDAAPEPARKAPVKPAVREISASNPDAAGNKRPASSEITVAKVDKPPTPAKDVPRTKANAGRADENVRDLHRVNRGETLTGIAQQYGVSVNAIKTANNMSENTVRIGAVLAIPSG
ncbi:N-acetylmuramoyl-L-alanine amidase [Luteibacter sp. Sphag1AF]|uniref:N-acetylmuramoyl-L-alanine amidase n=1 Tax=Luteibacter sp. Sphag1AF TaxID=2587031 RepID=UPI001837BE6B|nr:N-acetylmuramoyl-L-alanine amidase [Luteibacter sp. Sphag1AF]